MRSTCRILATLLICCASVARAEDDAEALFKKVEATLTSATTLQFKFKTEMIWQQGPTTIEGSMSVKKGNAEEKDKLRLVLSGEANGRKWETLLVSDGKRLQAQQAGFGTSTVEEPPERLEHNCIELCLRAGAYFGPAWLANGHLNSDAVNPILSSTTGFKVGAREQVGDRDTQAVEFETTSPSDSSMRVYTTLWVDAKGGLPVKIVSINPNLSWGITLTETWQEVEVGKDIDDKVFELPK